MEAPARSASREGTLFVNTTTGTYSQNGGPAMLDGATSLSAFPTPGGAVPEPSYVLLSGILALGIVAARRLKKQAA